MRQGYTCLWRKVWDNAILAEPGKRFSRFEAWLYITNVLATGVDNPTTGLKRGEFVASIRQLAESFSWSIGSVHGFLEILLQNSMIMRVERECERQAGHFSVCNYEIYNTPSNAKPNAQLNIYKEGIKESIKKEKRKDTPAFAEASAGEPAIASAQAVVPVLAESSDGLPAVALAKAGASAKAGPKILIEIYQQHNQSLPEVKALTSERLKKCRSRINQAVRDGCLEQYLADFTSAVKKAQSTPFLRGEGTRGWRASFDWFVGNHVNVYAVLEGKYDTASFNGGGSRQPGRTSRGDLLYIPRQ